MTKCRCDYVIFSDALRWQELFILALNNITFRKAVVCQQTEFLLSGFIFFFLTIARVVFLLALYKICAFQGKYCSTVVQIPVFFAISDVTPMLHNKKRMQEKKKRKVN